MVPYGIYDIKIGWWRKGTSLVSFYFDLLQKRVLLFISLSFVTLTYYDVPNIKFVGIKWAAFLKEDASEDNTEDLDDKDIDKESKETSQASENSEEVDTKKGKYKDTFPLK